MPAPEKPRHRSGYLPEDAQQVRSACLTVAVTLGAYMDDLCIVGGLVPSLLIDQRASERDESDLHPGTNDLDIGLSVALLNEERYKEMAQRLRQEGFGPDVNPNGNPAVQRWKHPRVNVTIDFLMPPLSNQRDALRVQFLENDLGAIVMPGLQLAFAERALIDLTGETLFGEEATRTIPVCGPGAFIVLKSLAFGHRAEPKDAYDLVYVLRGTEGAPAVIARRLLEHGDAGHREIIGTALDLLARDFGTLDAIGPRRVADFEVIDPDDLDAKVADAHGYVDDLLRMSRDLGLLA